MTYRGTKKAKNLIIYEKVPKTFANSAKYITVNASGARITVVEEDPSWMILFPEVNPGDELSITYETAGRKGSAVPGQVDTEVYAESLQDIAPPALPAPPAPPQICTAAGTRCSGNLLQRCSDDGTRWNTVQTCQYGCDAVEIICKEKPQESPAAGSGAEMTNLLTQVMVASVMIIIILILSSLIYLRHMGRNRQISKKVRGKREPKNNAPEKNTTENEDLAGKTEDEKPDLAVAATKKKPRTRRQKEKKQPEEISEN